VRVHHDGYLLEAIPVENERELTGNYSWAISIVIRKITIATRASRTVKETKSIEKGPTKKND
jgi:hypothetical protein